MQSNDVQSTLKQDIEKDWSEFQCQRVHDIRRAGAETLVFGGRRWYRTWNFPHLRPTAGAATFKAMVSEVA